MKDLDKYRGCLLGCAAGDALGYTIEFWDEEEIFTQYGDSGITEYELTNGVALISDDTQMTLFTANGLLYGTTRGMTRGIGGDYSLYVANAYKDWLLTQTEEYPINRDKQFTYSWLLDIPELFDRRYPGRTCLSAIHLGANGTIEEPINRSKGCGGVMRVAPVGLYFEEGRMPAEKLDRLGAEVAAITHGHEVGYIPAATLTHIIRRLSHEIISIEEAVKSSLNATQSLFDGFAALPEYMKLMNLAVDLSKRDMDDLDAIHKLGEGWVADEALAIAIYCALKYPEDFDSALIAAVNHQGDSDSTGAITGNIVGAHIGLSGIPEKYTKNLELKDIILEMADDLYNDCQISEDDDIVDELWESKYIAGRYPKSMK